METGCRMYSHQAYTGEEKKKAEWNLKSFSFIIKKKNTSYFLKVCKNLYNGFEEKEEVRGTGKEYSFACFLTLLKLKFCFSVLIKNRNIRE